MFEQVKKSGICKTGSLLTGLSTNSTYTWPGDGIQSSQGAYSFSPSYPEVIGTLLVEKDY
jgi:hypothetical protein